MTLVVTCDACGATRSVNERLAGRTIRCPDCEAELVIPSAEDFVEPAVPVEAIAVEAEPVASEAQFVAVEAVTESVSSNGAIPGDVIPQTGDANDGRTMGTGPMTELDDDDDEAMPPRKKRDDDELDMTPMVDVTFLLLIFFMVTASFSLQKSIKMPRQQSDLPSTNNEEEPEDELDPIELEIDENGGFLLLAKDGETEAAGKINLINAMRLAAGEEAASMQLNIKVHEEARLQSLVDGMDSGTKVGFMAIQVTQVDGFD
ncbi:MAG: biopolymer transporter ExbD [Planctomycetota bacterium]